jgi:hypothetical protein
VLTRGTETGPLHGVPITLKDANDVARLRLRTTEHRGRAAGLHRATRPERRGVAVDWAATSRYAAMCDRPPTWEAREGGSHTMHRPIGVTILALVAGLAGLFQIWRALVFMGWASWTFVGNTVKFEEAQWGSALWAILIAVIWFWVAVGFWNVRAYAWSFGNFIALFTVIFGFFALLGGSGTMESETIGWLLAIGVFFYLNYPGVRNAFMEHEVSLLTPAQRAAMEQMQAAQMAMAQATAAGAAAPAAAAPAPAAPPPAAPPPPAPPADPGTPSS